MIPVYFSYVPVGLFVIVVITLTFANMSTEIRFLLSQFVHDQVWKCSVSGSRHIKMHLASLL